MTKPVPETQPWWSPGKGDVLTLRDGSRRWTVEEADGHRVTYSYIDARGAVRRGRPLLYTWRERCSAEVNAGGAYRRAGEP